MQGVAARHVNGIHHYRYPIAAENARLAVIEDLLRTPKRIHPKWFYDERGSLLFDEITVQPEYYPTRAERQILRRYANAIAAHLGADTVLIEPGAGTCEKAELFLDALRPAAYVPLDIAGIHIRDAAYRLAQRFNWLDIHAITADYCADFQLPPTLPEGRRVVFYPGSTLGNFAPDEARAFLERWRELAGSDGAMLIGIDLEKDPALLHQAYNDARGITARFNLNMLRHLNRDVGATFNVNDFSHVAFYRPDQHRIEMHLESLCDQRVHIGDCAIELARGERIHTESSYKFTTERFTRLVESAGWRLKASWHDREELFGIHYLCAD